MKRAKNIDTETGDPYPCRVQGCERPAICKGLCNTDYVRAKRGLRLPLKGSFSPEPTIVPWLFEPVMEPVRPKWEFAGNEQSLIDADEANNLEVEQSEENKEQ